MSNLSNTCAQEIVRLSYSGSIQTGTPDVIYTHAWQRVFYFIYVSTFIGHVLHMYIYMRIFWWDMHATLLHGEHKCLTLCNVSSNTQVYNIHERLE